MTPGGMFFSGSTPPTSPLTVAEGTWPSSTPTYDWSHVGASPSPSAIPLGTYPRAQHDDAAAGVEELEIRAMQQAQAAAEREAQRQQLREKLDPMDRLRAARTVEAQLSWMEQDTQARQQAHQQAQWDAWNHDQAVVIEGRIVGYRRERHSRYATVVGVTAIVTFVACLFFESASKTSPIAKPAPKQEVLK